MGYDMQMVETPTTVPEGMTLQSPDSPGYHRYTIRAMPVTVLAMEWANVLEHRKRPDFPTLTPEAGARLREVFMHMQAPEMAAEQGVVPPSAEEQQAAEDYKATVQGILDAPGEGDVPPSYKFESNDGWLVTPAECLKIADAIDENNEMIASQMFTDAGYTAEDGREWLTCWANYNRLAASHGGYRVR